MQEEWRDIANTGGAYQISNFGNVRKYIPLRATLNNNGYEVIHINGKTCTIHRLVAEAFVDNPNNLPLVNHKDEVKTNNCATNLEWCDHRYNVMYNGHNASKAVIAITDDYQIEFYSSLSEASEKMGVSIPAISKALRDNKRTCNGRRWYFNI